MNVLEAIKQLKDYENSISALTVAIDQLRFRGDYHYEVGVLEQIKGAYEKKHDQLQHQLEITPLATVRSAEAKVIGGEL